ncbi:MAG: hypothetical protein AAGF11_25435 [Myxococcota bacterium]
MVADGTFRRDLFFRLSQVMVWLPPVRKRGEDVLVLARRFAKKQGEPGYQLPEAFEQTLRRCTWLRNVRELRQVIHTTVALAGDGAQTSSG